MDGSLLKQHTHTHNSWNANGNRIGNGNMSNRTRFLSVLRNLHLRNPVGKHLRNPVGKLLRNPVGNSDNFDANSV